MRLRNMHIQTGCCTRGLNADVRTCAKVASRLMDWLRTKVYMREAWGKFSPLTLNLKSETLYPPKNEGTCELEVSSPAALEP